MSRDPAVFLDDIAECCDKVLRYTSGMTFDDFWQDEKTVDAVIRNLEIIGEAANHLPVDLRTHYLGADWRRVIAFRNLVVHQYFGVDLQLVWDVVETRVPQLRERLNLRPQRRAEDQME